MTTLTPTTKLEAVNQMLSGIGEDAVNSLESGYVTAKQALTILNSISRECQIKGWSFNTDLAMTISPDLDGFIQLPKNTLLVDGVDSDFSERLVQRGSRLYDRVNHTYNIDRPVTVDLTILLDFEEIPEAARNYIAIRAMRKFQDDVLGDDAQHTYQERDELSALLILEDAESQVKDVNVFNSPEMQPTIYR